MAFAGATPKGRRSGPPRPPCLTPLLSPGDERKAAAGGPPRGWRLLPASKLSLPTRGRPGPMRPIGVICGGDPMGLTLTTPPPRYARAWCRAEGRRRRRSSPLPLPSGFQFEPTEPGATRADAPDWWLLRGRPYGVAAHDPPLHPFPQRNVHVLELMRSLFVACEFESSTFSAVGSWVFLAALRRPRSAGQPGSHLQPNGHCNGALLLAFCCAHGCAVYESYSHNRNADEAVAACGCQLTHV